MTGAKTVYINGIGIISRCACSADDLSVLISQNKANEIHTAGKIDYTPAVSSSLLRRCSRYTKLAAEAAERSAKDGNINSNGDMYRIGTVISTGYGAAEYNTMFAASVAKGDPALCSPLVFANTVPNSCVGQICMIGGYKGVSTLLMGGDPLEYTAMLLDSDKADTILCGSVEEYFGDLADAVMLTDAAKGCEISEGAAVLTVSSEKNNGTYCKAAMFGSSSFDQCPLLYKITAAEAENTIDPALKMLGTNSPDIVFSCANGTYFDDIEMNILKKFFPDSVFYSPKRLFGETLGCGYMLSITLAAAALKGQELSFLGSPVIPAVNSIAVTGIDMAGNYLCTLLEAV